MFVRRSRLKPQVNLNCQRRRDDPNHNTQAKKVDTRPVKKAKTTNTPKASTVNESKTLKPLEVKKDETPTTKSNDDFPIESSPEKLVNNNEEVVNSAVIAAKDGIENETVNDNNVIPKALELGSHTDKSKETHSVANGNQSEPDSANEKANNVVEPFKMPLKVAERSLKDSDLYSLKNDIIQKDLKNSYKAAKSPPSIGKSQNNLSSPDSPQMNEISKDPSSPVKTAITRERTLSGSALVGKKSAKRIRTESSSSTFFDTYSNYTANKLRKMDEQRRLQRAETRKTIAAGVTDKSNLKMFDLIYYNPPGDPMQSTPISTNIPTKQIVELNENDADDPSEGQTADSQSVAPQLKIGDNGEIIVDHKSLQIETTVDPEAKKHLANSSAIVLDEDTGMNGFYTRKPRTKDWSRDETIKFYRCLQMIGTDFSCMSGIFPNRTRRELKLKFKREERINASLIDKAIMYPKEFNIEQLHQQWEEDDRRARDRLENEPKEPDKAVQKRAPNMVMTAMQNGDVVYDGLHPKKSKKGKTGVKATKSKINNNDQNHTNNNKTKNNKNINDKNNKSDKNNTNDKKKTNKKVNNKNKDSKEGSNNNKNDTTINNNNNNTNNNNAEKNNGDVDDDDQVKHRSSTVNGKVVSDTSKSLVPVITTKSEENENEILEKEPIVSPETGSRLPKKKMKPTIDTPSNKETTINGTVNSNGKTKSKRSKMPRPHKENPDTDIYETDLILSGESVKNENDPDDSMNHNKSGNRGERTVSGDSLSLDQIEDELNTLMNSDDTLLDQVELDSLTEAERALLTNPNTPRKEYKDFIQKSLNNNFNYVKENTKMPLPDISSIMERLHENKMAAISGMFNGLPEPKQNADINEIDAFRAITNNYQLNASINNTLNGQYLVDANNFGNMENGYGNLLNGINSNLNELSGIERSCNLPSTVPSNFTLLKQENIHPENSMDSFGDQCSDFHENQDNAEEDQELDVKQIQEILEKISDGTMALVSTLDPNNSDKVMNEIFYVNKDTGELSEKPLNLSEELVQSILEVIS